MVDLREERCAMLVGGTTSPGVNGVISSVVIECLESGIVPIGIYRGFKFIKQGLTSTSIHRVLEQKDVSRIHNVAGSIIGTSNQQLDSRTEIMNTMRALEHLKVKYLVTIGGTETAFSAHRLAQHCARAKMKIFITHVPKTIFNDLPLPPNCYTFGFSTARELGVKIVNNLSIDGKTMGRWYFCTVIGARSGHLTLDIGKAAAATLILIPEQFEKHKAPDWIPVRSRDKFTKKIKVSRKLLKKEIEKEAKALSLFETTTKLRSDKLNSSEQSTRQFAAQAAELLPRFKESHDSDPESDSDETGGVSGKSLKKKSHRSSRPRGPLFGSGAASESSDAYDSGYEHDSLRHHHHHHHHHPEHSPDLMIIDSSAVVSTGDRGVDAGKSESKGSSKKSDPKRKGSRNKRSASDGVPPPPVGHHHHSAAQTTIASLDSGSVERAVVKRSIPGASAPPPKTSAVSDGCDDSAALSATSIALKLGSVAEKSRGDRTANKEVIAVTTVADSSVADSVTHPTSVSLSKSQLRSFGSEPSLSKVTKMKVRTQTAESESTTAEDESADGMRLMMLGQGGKMSRVDSKTSMDEEETTVEFEHRMDQPFMLGQYAKANDRLASAEDLTVDTMAAASVQIGSLPESEQAETADHHSVGASLAASQGAGSGAAAASSASSLGVATSKGGGVSAAAMHSEMDDLIAHIAEQTLNESVLYRRQSAEDVSHTPIGAGNSSSAIVIEDEDVAGAADATAAADGGHHPASSSEGPSKLKISPSAVSDGSLSRLVQLAGGKKRSVLGQGLYLEELLDRIDGCMIKRASQGKSYGTVVLSEGLADLLNKEDLKYYFNGSVDSAHAMLAHVLREELVKRWNTRRFDMYIRTKNLGFELRSAPPDAQDIILARELGFAAMYSVKRGINATIVAMKGGQVTNIPLSEVRDPDKPKLTAVKSVNVDSLSYLVSQSYTIRLLKADLRDPAKLASYARIANCDHRTFLDNFTYIAQIN